MTVYDSRLGGAVERMLCEVPTVVIAEDAGGIIGAEVDVEEELDGKSHEAGGARERAGSVGMALSHPVAWQSLVESTIFLFTGIACCRRG